ncbi:acyl-CoA carboxylase subunit beta [Chelatococcus reniformis]|uniref:Acetyl-CoA carboxylase carboxyltransferase subunit n=1 Tax=Chelatococcus reniformis TaxID=1494448 RepID=A0A916XEI0_9HYPH|nr:carboxyl transferase domain-containing protein [Chelatococcus reniformis]GGC68032.1 acetyl-CoA carboxylase carboxyltransferase subunit [Chelatococcus reniformis]
MPAFESRVVAAGPAYEDNRAYLLAAIDELHALQRRARDASAASGPRFARRGQLLPRERLVLALDEGAPFLELCSLAGYLRDTKDPAKSVPGCSGIAGIGYISGVRCLIVADDSGIAAGSAQPMGGDKFLRLEAIALKNRLPFIHLVESAGANLLGYKVEDFVVGGGIFAGLARLSAAGLPVIALTHGSSTAGGAYMTGLADYVIMVRDRAKAFLAGPPLLKAATGEIATDEELGGALMHATVSGLAEYLAEDDVDGIRILRDLVASLGWTQGNELPSGPAPRLDPEELLGLFPKDGKKPVDMREVIARIVDGSEMLEYKPLYGPQTVCAHAKLSGMPIGIITNNGPLDPAGANKATQFIQACCQTDTPLIYLQNTTGYIVGTESERAGMIKIGSKMIQAVANASVPQLTLMCGASYGAGNYGMCGRGFSPDFAFSWPTARTAVMGAEQAALTMAIVMEDGAKLRGLPVDTAGIESMKGKIIQTFESQMSAFYTSGAVLDDGVIDPRDTRNVLAMALSVCLSGRDRKVKPLSFGVGRM